ncbi:hypothetical protein [Chitinophaga sp. LS1]|uniref:hypothetical protein n=1 Tax=Chitinophaga sp. LS1 TaxID=3051176 RepID=UPI002AAB0C2A|nr:hypothetical protein [Chitinophaga sp. LS1]WPV65439.1 hypothetical protein QQL36_26930 [Chitinophaga sp. LS1]
MDLNLLTIARRANLYVKIHNAFESAKMKLDHIERITDKIYNSTDFSEEEKLQTRENAIIGTISITEHVLNEVLFQVIISHPKKLGNKKFDIDDLLEEGSILELFYKKGTQKILDLAYGRFDKFILNVKDILELNGEIPNDMIDEINEIKCTRDCLIHSAGKATELYISKAGFKARCNMVNHTLKIDIAYYKRCMTCLRDFLDKINFNIPVSIKESKKASIFKQMWESTCLNRRIKFEKAWEIIDSSLVRPIDIDNTYGFSSSELEVYNLFRQMYNGSYKVDFTLYFGKWKPQTNEYQIAISWLENQFFF